MATRAHAHPAIAAGLAGGIGLVIPTAAYLTTLSIDGARELAQAGSVPFAVGVLAGVGLYSIANAALDAGARRSDSLAAGASATGEAPVARQAAATGPAAGDSSAAAPAAGASGAAGYAPAESRKVSEAHESASAGFEPAARTGMFGRRRRSLDDVPVIARAQDALPEDAAWAELDSMLDDGTSISCDAATSKDIYQIAFEELARGASAQAAAAAGAAPSQPATSQTGRDGARSVADALPADVTASILSSALQQAAVTAALSAEPASDELDTDAARRQALSSLDSVTADSAAEAPGSALDAGETTVIPVQGAAQPADAEDGAEATGAVSETPRAAAPVSALAAPAPQTGAEAGGSEFAGHEDMWAAALAILDEGDGPADAASAVTVPAQPAVARPIGLHAASGSRAAAIAEGRRETAEHGHVNELLDEELARVPSKSVRRTGREYLRVIQGGTMSMPRLKAEA